MVWVMRMSSEDMAPIDQDLRWGGVKSTLEVSQVMREEGRPIDPARLPRDWLLETKRKTLPDYFRIQNGYRVVSDRFRTLLAAHEIGACQFFDITIRDPKDQIREGDYSILNVVDHRNTLIPEASNVELFNHGRLGPILYLPSRYDPNFTLTAEAGSGLDLWREEKEIHCLYFSDRLVRACKTEKILGLRLFPATLALGSEAAGTAARQKHGN